MIVIGLTGGSGTGKTTVMGVWAGLGAYCIDADEVYHRLLQTDTALEEAIRRAFPAAFSGDRLDRKALGRIVFADVDRRRILETLTHGAVIREIERLLAAARRGGHRVAAVDAVALLDGPLAARCAALVCVLAPLEARLARIVARDGVDVAYARARAAAGRRDEDYRVRCDFVLENNADPAALARAAEVLYRQLTGNR
ncbi:MAG: dephospho-CoA kinase [Oscillospiraceae bacterium]|jgi:dephospho-CoA kinase|nr:dephospho-CoA kinase [Oscillospiraceae bacterium]